MNVPENPWLRRITVAACGAMLLASCATEPVYRPKSSDSMAGYSDQQITLTRYRVSFSGEPGTPRARVEDYLLRRAAELTVKAGYSHFYFDNPTTQIETPSLPPPDSWNPDYGLTFSLGRRYMPKMDYFGQWASPGYLSDSAVEPVVRYTARAELVMLTPEEAAKRANALSAHDIIARLGETVTTTMSRSGS